MGLAVLVQASGNVMWMQKGGLEQHWAYFSSAVPSMGCVPEPGMLYKKRIWKAAGCCHLLRYYPFWPGILEVLPVSSRKIRAASLTSYIHSLCYRRVMKDLLWIIPVTCSHNGSAFTANYSAPCACTWNYVKSLSRSMPEVIFSQ